VVIPLAQFGERHFKAEIRFDDLGDLAHRVAETRAGVLRAVRRGVSLRVGVLQHLDRVERFAPCRAEHGIGGLRILRREGVGHHVGVLSGADAELAELADRERRRRALQ
jgi:hypothetical protein